MSVIRLVDRSNSRGLFEKLSSPKRILNHEIHWEKEGGDNDIERRNERFDPLRFLGERFSRRLRDKRRTMTSLFFSPPRGTLGGEKKLITVKNWQPRFQVKTGMLRDRGIIIIPSHESRRRVCRSISSKSSRIHYRGALWRGTGHKTAWRQKILIESHVVRTNRFASRSLKSRPFPGTYRFISRSGDHYRRPELCATDRGGSVLVK